MKSIFVVLLVGLPLLGFGQVVDTVAVGREVDSLVQLNRKLVGERKFDQALEAIEKAEIMVEVVFGKKSSKYGNCLHNHGRTYQAWGRNTEAESIYLEAIAIRKEVLGKDHFDYANSLNNLSNLYQTMGRYDLAEPLALETKSIREKNFGKEHPDYAASLNNLATLYKKIGKYESAKQMYIEAKDIGLKLFGKESIQYALNLNNLATLYWAIGEYKSAEGLFIESISIREKILGKNHPDYAENLYNLGGLYLEMDQYESAEKLFLEANLIFKKVYGEDNLDYAESLNALGTLYSNMGRYKDAEIAHLKSEAIQKKILGENNVEYARNIYNLAGLYIRLGRYEEAENLFLETKDVFLRLLGKENRIYATNIDALALVYKEMGRLELAEQLFLESKSIREKTLGKEHLEYAETLNNLGGLYLNTGKYDLAEPLYLEAIGIKEKIIGKDNPEYANGLLSLALLYNLTERHEEARLLHLEAKNILEKTKGQGHFDYALNLEGLANSYEKLDNYGTAERLYLECKNTFEKTVGVDHIEYKRTLYFLINLYWQLNRSNDAIPLYFEAEGVQRSTLEKSSRYLSEKELSQYISVFNEMREFYFSFIQYNSLFKPEVVGACINNVLFQKGFLLESVSARSKITQSDTAATQIDNLQNSYLRLLSREYSKQIAERDSTHIAEWEEKANSLEKELVRSVAGYGNLVRQVSWQEVKEKLPKGSAAIEFISYHYYTPQPTDSVLYAALVLLPSDTTPHFIPLFEERQLLALLNRPDLSEKLVLKELYGNNPELRRLIWDPLEPLLRDVKTIYYSPSGLLHRLNPGALLDASNQALSEGRQWVRVGSTRELVTGRLADRSFALVPEGNSDNPLTAMVYGGITYDMDSLAFAAANPTVTIDSTENPRRKDGAFNYIITEEPVKASGTRGNPDGSWDALTATGQEADQVSDLLAASGFRTQKMKDYSASEERFKQIGVGEPSPRILHIATHGFSYPDPKKDPPKGFGDSEPTYKMLDDPMLRSGLLLAGANYYWKNKRPLANREDGVLVAYEVRDLNLRNTELAVLSACQTGLGDVVGSEGVYGLQRAFRIAGAKFLIVSLWEVPDAQTQELMRLFYQNWLEQKESLRDALNHAQQALREREPNPYMWAGFVLVE